MVYSSSRTGTRSLIKTAVLCALSLSVIPSTYAAGSLDASSSGDVCGLSDGDKSVGIRVIDDSSCASGGLGCYNDHCRYCKLLETPQSTSFENCTTFGVDFPTMAPLVASVGTCEVSSGDAAVGISAIADPTCLYGGLGCFNDHCRFCKLESTAQSEAFVDCTASNSTDGTSTEAPVDPTTSAPSTTVDTDGDVPTSEVPTADNVDGSDVLDFSTDDSDFSDASDAETPVSTTDVSTETPSATTAVPDVTTEAPTATVETPAATTALPDATTEAPTATTAAVVPDATTEAPAQPTCPQKASEGDAAVGINIITDTSCSSGGVGCIDGVCRFCKVTTTTQSAAFVDCATVPTTTEAPTEVPTESPTEAPTETPTEAPTETPTEAPTETPTEAPTETPTEAPTETPTEAPTETPTEAPTETPTEAPTETPTEAPSGATCTQTVSEGDAAVGIDIVTDASCSAGGVGCIDNVCRFCKATETQQSSAFEDCSTITGVAAEALTGNAEAFSAKQTRADAPEPDNVPILSQYQAGAFVGGCVVAIAAVALVARAAKKANNSNANPNDGDNADDAESGQHVSPGPVPTEDDDEVTTISTEA
ncbi:hypothetical protein PRNP1_007948 [Phytophthora ramorum]